MKQVMFRYQIEEPVGVLEETAANDVTDYTDWSTFDGEP